MKGTSKYINGSDKLYIDLNVLAGGRLENGEITINSNNFNYSLNMVKDSVLKYSYISNNVRTISLNNLESGTQKLIYGDILANIGSDTNNYTRTDNTVTLKGVYVAEDGTKTNVNKIREKMGMVFQQFNLFPNHTVKGNILALIMQI